MPLGSHCSQDPPLSHVVTVDTMAPPTHLSRELQSLVLRSEAGGLERDICLGVCLQTELLR